MLAAVPSDETKNAGQVAAANASRLPTANVT